MKNHNLKNGAFGTRNDDLSPRKPFRQLPEKLRPSSDLDGHYDLDGVSFEKDIGVIVASDGKKSRLPRK